MPNKNHHEAGHLEVLRACINGSFFWDVSVLNPAGTQSQRARCREIDNFEGELLTELGHSWTAGGGEAADNLAR